MHKNLKSIKIKFLSTFLTLVIWTVAFADEKAELIFSLDLIRHGDRTPLKKIPNINYEWDQGLGQLSPRGMQQEYELGSKLRKKYIDNYPLLPKHYQSETLYVQSTNYDRTLMSAQSLLLGLYPLGTGLSTLPEKYQPIPIHTHSKERDPLHIHFDTKKIIALMLKERIKNPEWKAKKVALERHFPRWSEATGMKISGLQDVVYLADALYVYQLNSIPIPMLNQDEINFIIQNGYEVFLMLFQNNEISRELAAPSFKLIHDYINDAIKQKTSIKYVLLSAHDSNISSVMSALGSPLTKMPAYACDINFSLFKTGKDNYFVKITYNDVAVIVPGCEVEKCSLSQLKTAFKTIPWFKLILLK